MAVRPGRGVPIRVVDAAVSPDGAGLAETRVRFLSTGGDPGGIDTTGSDGVRAAILASWYRSRALQLPADRIELPYDSNPDVDTPLTRSAEPVLTRLAERLDGQAVSIVLTDAAGLVLSRRTGDGRLDQYLDRVLLAPGFSYAERFVGTNGIGTTLEAGAPTQVFGHEHYAENLEMLACAAVPIHDPVSGRTIGAMNLTCWRKDAQALLLALAKGTAEQIQAALLADSGMREFQVLQAYRQACLRTSGIVFALTDDGALLNDHARAELAPGDQETLLSRAAAAGADLAPGGRRSLAVTLPTGVPARLHCRQIALGTEPAGLVVHVRLGHAHEESQRRAAPQLPGLAGTAPLWQRAVSAVSRSAQDGTWVVLAGEPGTGKLALLRAAHQQRHPHRRLEVADARTDDFVSTLRTALADAPTVAVTHLDAVFPCLLPEVAGLLAEAAARPAASRPWVGFTRNVLPDGGPDPLAPALVHVPTTVVVPALRMRTADLPPLVALLLRRAGSTATCSAEAMHLLMRAAWPGNVAQLSSLLTRVTQRRRGGVVAPDDLPPELHTVSRRVLSPLETLERDAIVIALSDADGNKPQAAYQLGMSRATIYRKIRDFGIVAPA